MPESEHERQLTVLREAAGAKIAQCTFVRGSDEKSGGNFVTIPLT